MSRLRAGAAIFSTAILSVMVLASCQTDSATRPYRPAGSSALDQPIGDNMRRTLESFRDDPEACRGVLRQGGVRASPISDQQTSSVCYLRGAVEYGGVRAPFSQDVRVSCPMAAALAVWEQQIVAPAAARYLKARVTRVEILSSYSCRTRNSKPGAPMSEHATGNAADIGGFRLSDGRVILVEDMWSQGADEAAFLHAVRDRSCDLFNAVLSPDYNWAHRNHLHFDLGRDRLCR